MTYPPPGLDHAQDQHRYALHLLNRAPSERPERVARLGAMAAEHLTIAVTAARGTRR